MNDRKVSWEVQTGTGKTSLSRFMYALLLCDGELRSHYLVTSNYPKTPPPGTLSPGTVVAIIRLAPEKVDQFKDLAKPNVLQYRSPTWFDRGSIRGIFFDPQREISTRDEEAQKSMVGALNEVTLTFVVGLESQESPPTVIARALHRDQKGVLQIVSESRRVNAMDQTYQGFFLGALQDAFDGAKAWVETHISRKNTR